MLNENLIGRFWRMVDQRSRSECWPWLGHTNRKGYGRIYGGIGQDNGVQSAHRVSYRIHYGAIPGKLWVLHRCDNPPCVNPAHLFIGTVADNVRDMMAKGRHV